MDEVGDSDYFIDESEDEEIDPGNYKGIYFGEEPGTKFLCPVTGAHFEFEHMCEILEKV